MGLNNLLKISIITAVYNRVDTVAQAVHSVSSQVYPHIEHLIIDGASTDGTMEEVERYRTSSMRIISEADSGIYSALNKGIKLASGDVVGVMHSDDFFANAQILEKVAAAFRDETVDAVYGDLDYVSAVSPDVILRRWRAGEFERKNLSRGWMPPHPTLFLRSRVFAHWGSYKEDYKISADYEAILRYFGCGTIRAAYIPEVLVKMRVGGESNRSLKHILRKSREDYRALRSSGVGGFRTLAWKNLRKLPQFFYS